MREYRAPRSRRAKALATVMAAGCPWLAPGIASAQKWTTDSGVNANLTYTTNAALGATGQAPASDTIVDVRPYFFVQAEGARLRLAGSASLDALTSVHNEQPSRVLVDGDLNGRLEAVQRFLFVDAGVRASQTAVNPFGPRPEATTTLNTLTTGIVHVAPSIEGDIGSQARYRLRTDNSWARESGGTDAAPSGNGYFGRHTARVEHDPRPLGWRLEGERSETRYRDRSQPSVTNDLARASVRYAFGPDLTAGLRVGRENTNLVTVDEQRHNVYGAEVEWHPSPRTSLVAFEERRFFGSSWHLALDQHLSRIAWNISSTRNMDTAPQSLLDQPRDNVMALLDSMFLSRFPDPVARARAVQDFIAQQGLSMGGFGPNNIYTQRLSVLSRTDATIAFLGVRSTLTLNAFRARTEDVTGAEFVTGTTGNNEQVGTNAVLTHRLTPTVSVNLSAAWSRIRALLTPDRSYDREFRVQGNMALSPRTTTFIALRHRQFDSNVASPGKEDAVSAGLDHRF